VLLLVISCSYLICYHRTFAAFCWNGVAAAAFLSLDAFVSSFAATFIGNNDAVTTIFGKLNYAVATVM